MAAGKENVGILVFTHTCYYGREWRNKLSLALRVVGKKSQELGCRGANGVVVLGIFITKLRTFVTDSYGHLYMYGGRKILVKA